MNKVKVSAIAFPIKEACSDWAVYYGPNNAVALFIENAPPIGKGHLEAIEKAIIEYEEQANTAQHGLEV